MGESWGSWSGAAVPNTCACHTHAAAHPSLALRTQVHLEAARALQFTESEFLTTLDMGAA
jgi:hypothetical protein